MYAAKTTTLTLVLALASLATARAAPLEVHVSIPPQKSFVERLGGPHVRVTVLLPPGQSPHTFEPTARQIAALANARVYFRMGLPFERRLVEKVRGTIEDLDIVDLTPDDPGHAPADPDRTERTVPTRAPDDEPHTDDDHDHHHHGAIDPHVWLNPRAVQRMAATIAATLTNIDPARADVFAQNRAAFEDELQQLDQRVREMLAPVRGRRFYVFHPAFGHLAEAYGLEQVSIEADGKLPTARQLGAVVEQARRDRVRAIFVQPQFNRRQAEVIAGHIGASIVTLDPLAENYIANLVEMAEKIRDALTLPADTGGGG